MTTAAELLALARRVLDGSLPMPALRAPRAAAILARQALEDAVRGLCASARADVGHARTRSQLIVLRALLGDTVADLAEAAWLGLSRACHHHAYELTPTWAEIKHLIELVDRLVTTDA